MNQPKAAHLPALFSLTLFLSAALVFLVQPMFGKMVLPRFGGAPAVWNTCQVFFQASLLVGYVYAHLVSTRLGIRWQVVVHGVVLLVPLISLPIAVAAGWEPAGDASPVGSLLGLLAVSVGLPFVVVSTTAPLLQAWFARSDDAAAGDPYFLYAASNAGSLLALLAYPLVLEPALPLSSHRLVWSGGYLLLVGLIVVCGIITWRSRGHVPSPSLPLTPSPPHPLTLSPSHPLTQWTRLHWLALAFVPSSLLLSVTLHITTDVAAVPLLWVVPLAIYLATFILAFARRQFFPSGLAARIMPLLVIVLVIVLVSEATHPTWLLMLVHFATFFVVSLVCHGELARLRPPPERLTEFYLWLSLGGILGGLFSGLIAPLVFRTLVEYPLVLVLACLLRPAPAQSDAAIADRRAKRKKERAPFADPVAAGSGRQTTGWRLSPLQLDFVLPIALGVAVAALIWISQLVSEPLDLLDVERLAIAFAPPAVICYLFLYRPVRFALGIAAILLASQLRPSIHGQVLHVERSFFGVHRVAVDPTGKYMQLVHGSTVHGKQRLADASASSNSAPRPGPAEPLNYYHRHGPAGDLFALPQVKNERLPVAVIGLGTGSLAAYAQPSQPLDYYEIDPVVQKIAQDRRYFTFLAECRGDYRILLGDARLKMGAARDGRYGLIVVDAFSSDAVPLHLITREAVALYVQKLAERGVIAFHVSNRYLDLSPVLATLARELDLVCLVRADLFEHREDNQGHDSSIWVVLARRQSDLEGLPRPRAGVLPRTVWTVVPPGSSAAWTDERANLFSAWRSSDSAQ
ncbi:MAG TPA: fused MFS/spermidine synthase [Pirellulaceae bacterium]|nr:fused MFS/spermidine synthase [Pirellulaceae bacterium]